MFQISDCWISWNDVQILLFSYLLYRKFQYMSVRFLMVWFVLKNIKITIKKHHPRALFVLFFLCWDFVLNKVNLIKYPFHFEGLYNGKWAPIFWGGTWVSCVLQSEELPGKVLICHSDFCGRPWVWCNVCWHFVASLNEKLDTRYRNQDHLPRSIKRFLFAEIALRKDQYF